MASGVMPSYSYRPVHSPSQPVELRSAAARRSRLFAGGTYFRSRDVGGQQNLISVQIIEYAPESDAVCIVTNHAPSIAEQLDAAGVATAAILRVSLHALSYVQIDRLDTPAPRAQRYSISAQIAPPLPTVTELGPFSFSHILSIPSQLTAKLNPAKLVFTAADKITIKPRYRVYRLVWAPVPLPPPTDPPTVPPPEQTYGWSITDLRAQVNASDPWIEMMERSGETPGEGGGPPVPNPNPPDVQDEGIDGPSLIPFAETMMSGGDGLPDNPNTERTGPSRSVVHLRQSEAQNGELVESNVVYEWAGESVTDGSWRPY